MKTITNCLACTDTDIRDKDGNLEHIPNYVRLSAFRYFLDADNATKNSGKKYDKTIFSDKVYLAMPNFFPVWQFDADKNKLPKTVLPLVNHKAENPVYALKIENLNGQLKIIERPKRDKLVFASNGALVREKGILTKRKEKTAKRALIAQNLAFIGHSSFDYALRLFNASETLANLRDYRQSRLLENQFTKQIRRYFPDAKTSKKYRKLTFPAKVCFSCERTISLKKTLNRSRCRNCADILYLSNCCKRCFRPRINGTRDYLCDCSLNERRSVNW